MTITIDELVAIPHLRSTLVAGEAGKSHRVRWAHVCEMPRPWEWLGEGDLLMTSGFGLPKSATLQERYVKHLADNGIAGATIARDVPGCPPVTSRLLKAADRLDFPVLRTSYDVAFVEFSHVICMGSELSEQRRFRQTVLVYETLKDVIARLGDGNDLLAELGARFGCEFHVVDQSGRVLFGAAGGLDGSTGEAITMELASRSGSPAVIPLTVDGRQTYLFPIPSRRNTFLVVHGSDERPCLSVTQHIATVTSVEIERLMTARDARRSKGMELFAQLVDRRADTTISELELRGHGLGKCTLMVLAVAGGAGDADDVHQALYRDGVAHLLLQDKEDLLIAVEDDAAAKERVRGAFDDGVRIGESEPFKGVHRFPDAARESRWALQVARSQKVDLVRYGQSSTAFVPRTLTEAEEVVGRVLGQLLAYEAEHGTELLGSLRVFLAEQRSWQNAARVLNVHKQTLAYRLGRVEEITGRSLRETQDLAELHLALGALDLLAGQSTPDCD